jgi:hypothetical protein
MNISHSQNVQTSSEAHPASTARSARVPSQAKRGWGTKLTTHLHPELWLRIGASTSLLPLYAFMACMGTNFFSLKMNEVVNIVALVAHRVGTNITQYKLKGHAGKYWFDDQCREKRKLIREALRTYISRNDKNSSRKYWERGMRYRRKKEWQNKEEDRFNHTVKRHVTKKPWESIRNVVRKGVMYGKTTHLF